VGKAGVVEQLQARVLDELDEAGRFDLERVSVDSFNRRLIESSQRLGRYRWTIERTGAWRGGWRRPRIRDERCSERFYALAMLACSVICCNAFGRPRWCISSLLAWQLITLALNAPLQSASRSRPV
jgi:hypothetical protein